MERATLETLLARVLEGEGPDRELNAEIEAWLTGRVTHPRKPGWTFEKQDAEWKLARLADSPFISQASRPAPLYTASLDAALTLVPEGWTWARYHGGVFECAVLDERRSRFERGEAATPARALIAACIKARMEVKP